MVFSIKIYHVFLKRINLELWLVRYVRSDGFASGQICWQAHICFQIRQQGSNLSILAAFNIIKIDKKSIGNYRRDYIWSVYLHRPAPF